MEANRLGLLGFEAGKGGRFAYLQRNNGRGRLFTPRPPLSGQGNHQKLNHENADEFGGSSATLNFCGESFRQMYGASNERSALPSLSFSVFVGDAERFH